MHPGEAIWSAAGDPGNLAATITGAESLPSAFDVTGVAAGAIGAAGSAVAEFIAATTPHRPAVSVDRRLASLWLSSSIQPVGWTLPPAWDAVAGDYRAAEGWIRLHTNAPHHRGAALAVLGTAPDRAAVAAAVATWPADALEAAIVAAGGCAATMRAAAAWADHPQGRAVAAEPLVHRTTHPGAMPQPRRIDPARPLAGIRVLDLTRVLAGPTATRFLAAFGADVLRIDPPFWIEPSLEPEMTLGKRCAGLDLRQPGDADRFRALLAGADILVHGYRPGALDHLGLAEAGRRALNPVLIDVSLDAYGWTGPWAGRRGFDSLVQMSTGIAEAGMHWARADKPVPLPAQALDHVTGYILATTALRALTLRIQTGAGTTARASLARTAALLAPDSPLPPGEGRVRALAAAEADFGPTAEPTAWGPARRLRPPVTIDGAPMHWTERAGPLRAAEPVWIDR